ncbi:hypothetical protein M23134_05218 [Microscilla marina ATCC 23134]|uniref:Uncharacterized protein n=1 Tax=Microscilla marina ATCC 23134 TaxID=313606 RepID=A1ZDH3_MICM2|nr:hypothetical protein M23134_05218 [Microscilla marina ATCC 23134]
MGVYTDTLLQVTTFFSVYKAKYGYKVTKDNLLIMSTRHNYPTDVRKMIK